MASIAARVAKKSEGCGASVPWLVRGSQDIRGIATAWCHPHYHQSFVVILGAVFCVAPAGTFGFAAAGGVACERGELDGAVVGP